MISLLRIPFALPMVLYQSVALALAQIWSNKIRAILTTLGILIGVAAVSSVIALIDGMKQRVLSEFEAFGTNKLFINPQWRKSDMNRRGSYTRVVFKNDLFDDMLERCPSIANFGRDAGYGEIPVAYLGQVAEKPAQFNGVDPAFHELDRRGVTYGRGFSVMDSQQARRVCVIDKKLRDQLKLDRDPTGEVIDVAYFGKLLIVGLLEEPPAMGQTSDSGELRVPFEFTTQRFNWPTWYGVTASARSRDNVEEAKAEVEFYLRQKRHLKPGEEPNFRVEAAQRAIDEINEMAQMLTIVAGGIVAISLLVGGVGIMNIMLVSVSERTREIGLRKAVGARPGVICTQFLVEAVVLCLLGGALGLAVGQGITSTVASFIPANSRDWEMADPLDPDAEVKPAGATGVRMLLPASAIVLAFGFSGTVGLVFGMFPAIKAARLDPIDALRHE